MLGETDMPTVIVMLVMGIGLAAASGFRVFVPLFIASFCLYSGVIPIEHIDEKLHWIGSEPALIVFGMACLMEIGAYYVPWLDNALDSIAAPSAMVAGTLLAYGFAPEMSPALKWGMAIVAGGGSAAIVQTGTTLTRGSSTLTTGGLANPALSTMELIGSILLSILSIMLPIVAVIVLLVLLVIMLRYVIRSLARRRTKVA